MKLFAQIVTIIGLFVSGTYSYITDFSFEGIVAFLSFAAAFAATFFLSKSKNMKQTVGDNSKAYQAGRDLNIKE